VLRSGYEQLAGYGQNDRKAAQQSEFAQKLQGRFKSRAFQAASKELLKWNPMKLFARQYPQYDIARLYGSEHPTGRPSGVGLQGLYDDFLASQLMPRFRVSSKRRPLDPKNPADLHRLGEPEFKAYTEYKQWQKQQKETKCAVAHKQRLASDTAASPGGAQDQELAVVMDDDPSGSERDESEVDGGRTSGSMAGASSSAAVVALPRRMPARASQSSSAGGSGPLRSPADYLTRDLSPKEASELLHYATPGHRSRSKTKQDAEA
jgi:hypothetical protein